MCPKFGVCGYCNLFKIVVGNPPSKIIVSVWVCECVSVCVCVCVCVCVLQEGQLLRQSNDM
jgi:hypothetical protein